MRISDWSSDVCSSDLAYLRLVRPGLGEEAEHQRRRERPWLRREVAAAKDAHAAFLQHLALDGLLQRFARLDEAGQGGVAVRRPAGVPAEQQAAAVGDGDDHRRIGARVVFRSEEHTSELQSLMCISYAVYCYKKITTINT